MCGVCGFVHHGFLDEAALRRMNETIRYRGPDDEGYLLETVAPVAEGGQAVQLGLAHNRLSILDLSSLGHQPMTSAEGRVTVCYNGEIYNYHELRAELVQQGYTFHSNCDTEVILYAYEAWGIDCVRRFNGMFAIALWDRERRQFFLVRDRMGVKPLYYYLQGGTLVFGSELKPLMAYPGFPRALNFAALADYLPHQYITGPATIFRDTWQLEPGHILTLTVGPDGAFDVADRAYWSVAEAYAQRERWTADYETSRRQLQEILLDAVQLRLVSDVPVGAFLSGGYDSTLVTALMQAVSERPVRTFTIGFREAAYDESSFANAVAEHLGTSHTCRMLTLADAQDYIERIPEFYDQPMADASQIATMLLSQVTREQVTVSLSGDAGDELFCGYPKYLALGRHQRRYGLAARLLRAVDTVLPLRAMLASRDLRHVSKVLEMDTPEHIINADARVYWQRYAGLLRTGGHAGLLRTDGTLLASTQGRGGLSRADRQALASPEGEVGLPAPFLQMMGLAEEPAMGDMLTDMLTYLPDDILVKVDRASMSVSLESRSPLLDYRVVEMALALPLTYKCAGGQKRILRDIAYQYVPRDLLDRSKQGFGVPVTEWMWQDFAHFTRGLLDDDYIRRQGIFDLAQIRRMREDFFHSRDGVYGRDLWTLLVFQLWWERYMR